MNTSPIRIHPWKLLLAVVGVLLFTSFSRPTVSNLPHNQAQSSITLNTPSAPLARSQKELPFSVDSIVLFLRQNFRASPEETDRDYAFFRYVEREFDAMHYVAEFIEAPLFTRTESERLYGLLYAERPRVWTKVGRFHARGALLNVADGTEVSFEFSPDRPF